MTSIVPCSGLSATYSPPASYVEILTLKEMRLENGALREGIRALIKEAPDGSLASSTMWRTWWEGAIREKASPSRHLIHQPFDLELSSFWNCEKYISVVYRPPTSWHFVIAAWMAQDRCLGQGLVIWLLFILPMDVQLPIWGRGWLSSHELLLHIFKHQLSIFVWLRLFCPIE